MIAVVIVVYPLLYFVVYVHIAIYLDALEVYFQANMLLFFGPCNRPHVGGLRYRTATAIRLKANIPGALRNRFDSARARGYPRFSYKDGKLWTTLRTESIGLWEPIDPNRLSIDLSLRIFVLRDRGRPCPLPWHSRRYKGEVIIFYRGK